MRSIIIPLLCAVGCIPFSTAGQNPAMQKPSVSQAAPVEPMPFWVYRDNGAGENRFNPDGYMGDTGDIKIDQNWTDHPYKGSSCIRVEYTAAGSGPKTCKYDGPCKWAGLYWLEGPGNWGESSTDGFNLSRAKRLTFWARADLPCRIDFKVGGVRGKYGDTLKYTRMTTANLTEVWRQFEINLVDADLRKIIGGFCWTAERQFNPKGAIFYIDEIKYEQ